MNVFLSRHRHQPWVWQVTMLCFILGILLTGSLQTVSNIRRTGGANPRVGASGWAPTVATTLRKREKEISDLREEKTNLENVLAQGSGKLQALNDELQKTKLLGGLTEVEGQGVVLTLRDSRQASVLTRKIDPAKYTIHDYDLQMVVNELAACGAEAVAINGQRIVGRTPVRCVGPTIMVNSVPLTPPYEVTAIGDAAVLMGGLNLPGGYLDDLRMTDPAMFNMEKRAHVTLPAYAGSTEIRWMSAVTPKETSEKGSTR